MVSVVSTLVIRAHSPIAKNAVRYELGRSCEPRYISVNANGERSGRGMDADRTFHGSARDGCKRCPGGPGPGAVGFSRAAFPETNVDGVAIDRPDEGDVRAIGKARVVFDSRSNGAPFEIEVGDGQRALGISNVENDGVEILHPRGEFHDADFAHVHFVEKFGIFFGRNQAQVFNAGPGADADFIRILGT